MSSWFTPTVVLQVSSFDENVYFIEGNPDYLQKRCDVWMETAWM